MGILAALAGLAVLAWHAVQGGTASDAEVCTRTQWEGFVRLAGRWPGVWQRMSVDALGTLLPAGESYNATVTFEQDPEDPDVVLQTNYYQPGKQNAFDKGEVVDGWFVATYPPLSAAEWMFPRANSFRLMTGPQSYCSGAIVLANVSGVAAFELSLREEKAERETESGQDRRRAVFVYMAAADGALELRQVIVIWESRDGTWSNHSITEAVNATPPGESFDLSYEAQERSMHSLQCGTVNTTDFAVPAADYQLVEGEEYWVPRRLDLLGHTEIGIAWRVSPSEVRRTSMIYKKGRLDFIAHDVFRNLSSVSVMERPATTPGREVSRAHLLLATLMLPLLSACCIIRCRTCSKERVSDDNALIEVVT